MTTFNQGNQKVLGNQFNSGGSFGSCKNCKRWIANTQRDVERHGLPEGWGECVMTYSKDGKPETVSTKAYALDVERKRAFSETHADFGCVMFETNP